MLAGSSRKCPAGNANEGGGCLALMVGYQFKYLDRFDIYLLRLTLFRSFVNDICVFSNSFPVIKRSLNGSIILLKYSCSSTHYNTIPL